MDFQVVSLEIPGIVVSLEISVIVVSLEISRKKIRKIPEKKWEASKFKLCDFFFNLKFVNVFGDFLKKGQKVIFRSFLSQKSLRMAFWP